MIFGDGADSTYACSVRSILSPLIACITRETIARRFGFTASRFILDGARFLQTVNALGARNVNLSRWAPIGIAEALRVAANIPLGIGTRHVRT
jgi:hypothetical protein